MARKSALGKGVDNLIPNKNTENKEDKKTINKRQPKEVIKEVVKEVVKEVPIEQTLKVSQIEPNRDQPRNNFDEDALEELAASIKQVGLIQPIVVQKRDNYYEIIAGERRWRAAKLAKIKEVPVIIKDYSDQEIMEIALIENIQRENLNPIEEAMAYKKLIDEYSLLQDELAEKVSKSRTAITNTLRLLKLSPKVQQMVVDEMISSGHARALLAIEDEDKQYAVATKIFDEKLSVRDTEKLVKALLKGKKEKAKKDEKMELFYKEMSGKLATFIGTKVNINSKANGKGKIEIEYYSPEELERIYDLLSK